MKMQEGKYNLIKHCQDQHAEILLQSYINISLLEA